MHPKNSQNWAVKNAICLGTFNRQILFSASARPIPIRCGLHTKMRCQTQKCVNLTIEVGGSGVDVGTGGGVPETLAEPKKGRRGLLESSTASTYQKLRLAAD